MCSASRPCRLVPQRSWQLCMQHTLDELAALHTAEHAVHAMPYCLGHLKAGVQQARRPPHTVRVQLRYGRLGRVQRAPLVHRSAVPGNAQASRAHKLHCCLQLVDAQTTQHASSGTACLPQAPCTLTATHAHACRHPLLQHPVRMADGLAAGIPGENRGNVVPTK